MILLDIFIYIYLLELEWECLFYIFNQWYIYSTNTIRYIYIYLLELEWECCRQIMLIYFYILILTYY